MFSGSVGALNRFFLIVCPQAAKEPETWDARAFSGYGVGNVISQINPETQGGRGKSGEVHVAIDLREKNNKKGGV